MSKSCVEKKIICRTQHKCIFCRKPIKKGSFCYYNKSYIVDEDEFFTHVFYEHLKCHHKQIRRRARPCPHPVNMIETIYTYIPGECVKEPDHRECRACGSYV
jgi:hypothetical protein